MTDQITSNRARNSPGHFKRERIATECVCCASQALRKSPAILMPFVAERAFGWRPVEIDDSWGLQTIKNGHAYSICNSLFCDDCGLLFLDIRFSEAELNNLYDGYREQRYADLRDFYEPGYKQRNASLNEGINCIPEIEEFLTPHLAFPTRILDWGGDTGKNTPFRGRRSLLHIYDISNKPVVDGAELVDQATAFSTQYDLINCSNVLEHVPYPSQLIMDMKNAMNKETILYLEVPCEEIIRSGDGDKQLHLKKRHWHEHINFFNQESLRRLVNRCGLHVIGMREIGVAAGAGLSFHFQIACKLDA